LADTALAGIAFQRASGDPGLEFQTRWGGVWVTTPLQWPEGNLSEQLLNAFNNASDRVSSRKLGPQLQKLHASKEMSAVQLCVFNRGGRAAKVSIAEIHAWGVEQQFNRLTLLLDGLNGTCGAFKDRKRSRRSGRQVRYPQQRLRHRNSTTIRLPPVAVSGIGAGGSAASGDAQYTPLSLRTHAAFRAGATPRQSVFPHRYRTAASLSPTVERNEAISPTRNKPVAGNVGEGQVMQRSIGFQIREFIF